jgi:Mn-dependent DtxR family transcriptional regulator
MKTINEILTCKGSTYSTKEIATKLNISTAKAYKLLSELEAKELVYKYGYKTKNGWEDVDGSKLKPNSLYWQICH